MWLAERARPEEIMTWEIERRDRSDIRADDRWSRSALSALALATTVPAAERLYNCLLSALRCDEEPSLLTSCLVTMLARGEGPSRPFVLQLLQEIAEGWSGNATHLAPEVRERCVAELARGAASYFAVLELGTDQERACCVDILGTLAAHDPTVCKRVVWYFERCLAEPTTSSLRALLDAWTEYLVP
jgi:hypothetical protein